MHRLRVTVLALMVAIAFATSAMAPTSADADTVRDCAGFELHAFVYDFSVRNMSCRTAKGYIKDTIRNGFRFRKARRAGFSCGSIGSVYEGAVYRCHRGSRAFRFTFGV
jgi:hypothetical protein